MAKPTQATFDKDGNICLIPAKQLDHWQQKADAGNTFIQSEYQFEKRVVFNYFI